MIHPRGWFVIGSILLPCALGLAGGAPPAHLSEVQAFSGARLEPGAVQVRNQVLEAGRLRLELESGTVSRVKVGGKVLGLHFLGKGSLAYLSTEPSEAAALRFNLERNAGLLPRPVEGGQRVEDALEEAVLFYAGGPVPPVDGPADAAPGLAFLEIMKGFQGRGLPLPGHAQAFASGIAPHAPSTEALLRGAGGRYLFLREANETPWERFSLLRREGEGPSQDWEEVPLSASALQGAPRRASQPAFALNRVELDVKVHRAAPALITALETVIPARAGASILAFRLRSSFARWSGDASQLFTSSPVKVPVRLLSVELAEGGALAFDHRQDQLLVKFPQPLAAGIPVKLRFRIQDDSFREPGKGQAWTLGNAAWFPLGSPEDPGFQVHCRLEVEKPCAVVAPGRILAEEETAGTRILVTESDRPMTFYPCQGGTLESTVLLDPRTQVALRFVSAPGGGGQGNQPLARAIQGLIAGFETFLGPFPVKDLVVIRGETGPEGAVAPGMLYLGESRYSHKATLRDEEIARALAAQYWGAAVRGRSLDAPWIGGAFAQVCAGIALGKVGEQPGREVERWTQDARLVNDVASLSHAAWLRPRAGDYSWETGFRSMLELGKGPLVLQRIRTDLGEAAFLAFLAEVQRTFAWKTCDVADIAGVLARTTGKDWGPFFEKCYWGTELPECAPTN